MQPLDGQFADQPPESEAQSTESTAKTIFIAEDDPFISRMYQTKLTNAGFNVHLANNGRDAFEQIKVLNPDLIMLDINMPELTGFEVVRALQNEGGQFDANKIMVLTNSAEPQDRRTASELGIDYFVKAEMTPREVLEHIDKKLGMPGPDQSSAAE